VEGGDLSMSSSVENKVLAMHFDNKQFEEGIKETLASLDTLNKGLKLEDATKGLTTLGSAAKSFTLGNIASAVDSIADKFRTMSIIAITALTNIVNKAVNAGEQLVKSLTVDPIKAGLDEYETNLNSIQTILANTQHEGAKLKDVTDALNILNTYSDKTIYNFSEMARNIGTFTAAGVTLKVATEAIKGIANLAAVSGSNAQQASTAMYQLSQALAAGKVTLMDWNSVVNAGMGGKVFQDALMETARIHGVAIDKMVKDAGSFRNTLENGWLTGQILTETLSKFTGDLTAAQLKTMGYNSKQIAQILKMGQVAQDAATKVKTVSQLISTLQEAAGSGWAQTWQIIFGDFDEAKTLFTDVNNVLGSFISASANARNSVLKDWKELGGRTALIDAISNAFHALIDIIRPIKEAFREIFPATTGKQLYDLTVALKNFTAGLRIGYTTAENLKRTFAGVFAIFGIGVDIFKEVVKTLFHLFGVATEGSGSFLEITANIGDFFVRLRQGIQEGQGLVIFFERLGNAIAVPIMWIKSLTSAIAGLFGKLNAFSAADDVLGFLAKLEPITRLGDLIAVAWDAVANVLGRVWDAFYPLAQKFGAFFAQLGSLVTGAFGDIDYKNILATINTGLFAALVVAIKGFLGKFKGLGHNGVLSSIKESFEELTGTLKTMQTTLRAATLLEIALAVAALTVSVSALSKIDSDGLTRALTAMTVMFTQLFTSMAILDKSSSGFTAAAKMPFLTASMILLAAAVDILASAVKKLADLDWNQLSRGLTGMTVIIGVLVAAMKLMPEGAGLLNSATSMVILSAAVKILASAVKDLSGLSWEELAKGLTGVAGVLTALALFAKFNEANSGGIAQGAGIVLLAVGIKILASAMKDLGGLSWMEIAKGITSMAAALAIIGVALDAIPPSSVISAAGVLIAAASLGLIADALQKMGGMSWSDIGAGLTALAGALVLIGTAISLIPPTAPLSAAGILIVALALGMISDALKKMGGMSWSEIGKGLVTLAGALAIITAAMVGMTEALPGAAALLVVAAALAIITPVLLTLGKMSWEEIVKGLATLAGVFVVLGVAGALLTPVIPTLLGLGVAITLLGAGMALAGVGVLAFSAGLTALSISGAAGAAALVAIVSAMVGLIPMVMEQIGLGVIAFAKVIATAGPAITGAMTTVILALITAIEVLIPKIVEVLLKLLTMFVQTLYKYLPTIQDTGLKLLIALLNGIANNIGGVVTAVTNIIVAFINALGRNLPRIVQAGVDLIINFINGLTKAINDNADRMGKAGGDLAAAIVKGMIKGLAAGGGEIAKEAKNVAKRALDAAKDFLGIHSPSKAFEEVGEFSDKGLAGGLDKYSHIVGKAAEGVGSNALNTLASTLSNVSKVVSEKNFDLQPTITPVLDLSSVKATASKLGSILQATPIDVSTSATIAQNTASSFSSPSDRPGEDTGGSSNGTNLSFTQNNYSPKALSEAEIYRQTKNQLSKVKEVVAAA
jgi:tape measure domain-containing protein